MMSAPKDFVEVLKVVSQRVGCSHEDQRVTKDVVFCPKCADELIPGREMSFRCQNLHCGYQGTRALIFRKNSQFKIAGGKLYHYSVGAVIFCLFKEEQEERVLLLRRATHPVGAFTIPSGHWDLIENSPTPEDPQSAAKREIMEETGLDVTRLKLREEIHEKVPLQEECRRYCDLHIWHLCSYDCLPEAAGLKLTTHSERAVIGESDMIGWVPLSQVIDGQFLLTKPAGHFLEKILKTKIPNVLPR